MSLLDEEDTFDPDPTEPLPFSEEPRGKVKKKSSALSLGMGRPKAGKEPQSEKTPKKTKHVRSKSGSRTPPDSPRLGRGGHGEGKKGGRGGTGSHPSPNVKSHRKRYSQLGMTEDLADSHDEDTEFTGYFNNMAATEGQETQEPFFSIEKDTGPPPPSSQSHLTSSPGHVKFPVQFSEDAPPPPPPSASNPWFPISLETAHSPASPTEPFFPLPSLPPVLSSSPTHWPGTDPIPDPSPQDTSQDTFTADIPTNDQNSETATLESGSADSAVPQDVSPDSIPPEWEWKVSQELFLKCRKQFLSLQPSNGKLQGGQARSFFLQSRLPNNELSAIWRLADIDKDNALSEEEFCVAMKLVLLRRRGFSLPVTLPEPLRSSEGLEQYTAQHYHIISHAKSTTDLDPPLFQPKCKPNLMSLTHQSTPQLLGDPSSPLESGGGGGEGDNEEKTGLLATAAVPEAHSEPAVATIISLGGEENEKDSKEEEEEEGDESSLLTQPQQQSPQDPWKPSRPAPPKPVPGVRRVKSLKQLPANKSVGGGEKEVNVRLDQSLPLEPFSPPATEDTAPIITVEKPSPKVAPRKPPRPQEKDKAGYSTLASSSEDKEEEEEAKDTVELTALKDLLPLREKGHSRSTSLDLKRMMMGGESVGVYTDLPTAVPPKPPPKPSSQEDGDLQPMVRGRSASTGSISSTSSSLHVKETSSAIDTPADALLLSGIPLRPIRKAPILPPLPKPRRPPPPTPAKTDADINLIPAHVYTHRDRPQSDTSLLRNKGELQSTIRSLKDTNATLQAINKELEEKLFTLMEERVQLARELELAKQMQCNT